MEVLKVVSSPKQAMEVLAAKRRVTVGLGVVALVAVVNVVGAAIFVLSGAAEAQMDLQGLPDFSPGAAEGATRAAEIFSLVLAALLPFAWWVALSSAMQLATRLLGGHGPFSGTLAVVGAAFVPFLLFSVLGLLDAGLQAMLGPESTASVVVGLLSLPLWLAALAWHAALVVVGTRFSRRVSYGRASGAFALSVGALLVFALLLVVVLAVLVAVLVGAPAGP